MDAWPAPVLPRLDGPPAPLPRVFDTAGAALVQTRPRGRAGLYVCGITPYDATHVGHAATYVAFDLLVRAWRDAGYDVTYVQNVTDVDDPLIERAAETGEPWDRLAERETRSFREDMAALRVIPPTKYLGAVESLPSIVDLVQRLQQRGSVYEVDGDLYFSVSADEAFGTVSHESRDRMLALSAERGGDPDRVGKKDPLDCVVWRAERAGEPAWDSPLGPGRPGWHNECAAMALEHLGMGFDVQGGGNDLAFPHHEMSASQAQVATGTRPFARAYVHAGMVGLGGEKMSKSKGNLVFVTTLRVEGQEPAAIRLALLGHHYRDDWDWTPQDLTGAAERLARWRSAVHGDHQPDPRPLVGRVREALGHDLDAPAALAAVDEWCSAARERAGRHDPDAADMVTRLLDARLGVEL